ncbi:DNA-binding response regulator [Spirochaetia bacterium]|nr:DNA-binding response regulator [Spirochaetia bacterium]
MKTKQAVLVVDDEEKILQLVKSYLEINGYTALCAKSAGEGMRLFEQHRVSLILLDLMLPDFSGEEFCRRVRETSAVPIIMITAKVEEEDIIRGLRIGADDYVCKPFSPRQLMARVEAALRRGKPREAALFLMYDDLVVDTEKKSISKNGKTLVLTRDEYHILVLLMSRQAKIFTRDEILEAIKGETYDGFDRAIDTHIKNIRAKLGDDPKKPKYIVTVYGMGYRCG